MQCVPENSWGTRTPAISNNETSRSASPHSSVGEESDGSLEPEEGWDSGEQSKTVRRGSLYSRRLLLPPETRTRRAMSIPDMIFLSTPMK